MIEKYDRIIFGAGMFGLYSALISGIKGYKTLVIDLDERPFARASYVNQARVHNGYHYPRSISTAIASSEYFERFAKDYSDCINATFEKIYGISKSFSWTSPENFVDFSSRVGIPCQEVSVSKYFNRRYVDAAYQCLEYSFDAQKIRDKFLTKIHKSKVNFNYSASVNNVEKQDGSARVFLSNGKVVESSWFLNATYAGINSINEKFDFQGIESKYELCEVCIVNVSDQIKNVGLTLMDGPFFSLMPFGETSMHSLTSVQHTPHYSNSSKFPAFACQDEIGNSCRPRILSNCNTCPSKPVTKYLEMNNIAKKYLADNIAIEYSHSLFSVKTILKNSEIDDSRPTLIKKYEESFDFFSVFSGKINTIFDLDFILK